MAFMRSPVRSRSGPPSFAHALSGGPHRAQSRGGRFASASGSDPGQVHHPSLTLSLADNTVLSRAVAASRPPAGAIPVRSTILRSRSVWRTIPCSVARWPLRVRQRERSRSGPPSFAHALSGGPHRAQSRGGRFASASGSDPGQVHHPSLTLCLADHTVLSHAAAASRPPAGAIPVRSTILRSRSVWRTTPCSVTRRPLRVRQRERSRSGPPSFAHALSGGPHRAQSRGGRFASASGSDPGQVHHPSLTLCLADHTVLSHAAAASRPP